MPVNGRSFFSWFGRELEIFHQYHLLIFCSVSIFVSCVCVYVTWFHAGWMKQNIISTMPIRNTEYSIWSWVSCVECTQLGKCKMWRALICLLLLLWFSIMFFFVCLLFVTSHQSIFIFDFSALSSCLESMFFMNDR